LQQLEFSFCFLSCGQTKGHKVIALMHGGTLLASFIIGLSIDFQSLV